MLLLKNNINTIFIMLGSNCNLNCKYCMQHSLINKMQSYNSDINIDIINFIKSNRNIKLSLLMLDFMVENLCYIIKI